MVRKKRKNKVVGEAKNWLENGQYCVKNVEHVRHIIKQGNACTDEAYSHLTELIAELGVLTIPLREHPELREIWENEQKQKIK